MTAASKSFSIAIPDTRLDAIRHRLAALANHAEHQLSHHHMIFNPTIDVQDDVAHSEVYWLFFGDDKLKPNTLAVGRYVDRFERRDGRWAIAARVCLSECVNDLQQTELPEAYRSALMSNGPSSRDHGDRSWERPLLARSVTP